MAWEAHDRHLKALKEAPFRRSLPAVTLSPGVTLIRGPRQVGKSTWLKLLLKDQVDRGEECFYYTCEDLRDFQDLTALIQSQPRAKFFFLDEITFVEEWWRSIKKAADTRPDLYFILTGSNSYDLKTGMDLMPGRWSSESSGGGELFLFPMLFHEWTQMREQAGWPQFSLVDGLKAFMQVGGFPAALAETQGAATTPQNAKITYQRWIQGDVIKLGKQELFMRELMGQLVKIMGSSISLQGLAQKTQLMSYHTVQEYLSILEHAFALRTFYAYDPDTDSFRFKKEKKYYFTDPITYWVALEWSGQKAPAGFEDQLAEMIAAEYLARKTKRIGYYSTSSGEVDFISQRDWAVEVKWAPVVHNLSKAYKNLRIPNKRVWSQNNFFEE